MLSKEPTQIRFRRRSFVRRSGRITNAQTEAQQILSPQFGVQIDNSIINFPQLFHRVAPTYLEIGFGMGHSLLALAKNNPDKNFIGVETHKPGIGALFLGIKSQLLTNVRICDADIADVFANCIADNSLDGIFIFFPDPWQKRRHHPRRLIQPEFLTIAVKKLKEKGELHLATDWEDYAKHMLQVTAQEKKLKNKVGDKQFALRSPYRPIITKFEQRALREGRKIFELQLQKV